MIKEFIRDIYVKRELFYLVFLILLGIWLVAIHPFPVLVGSDPVVYQAQAIGIAHGKISYTENFLENIQQKTYDPFNLGVGGFQPINQTVFVPSKPQGFPIILAIAYIFFGFKSIFYVVPLIAVVLLIIVFYLGKKLVSPEAGLISATLVLFTPTNFWYSRIILSDVPAAFFASASLLAVLIALREKNPIYSAIASAIFIEGIFIRYTNILMIIPILTIFLLNRSCNKSSKQKLLAFFAIVGFGILSLLAYQYIVYGNPFSTSYDNSVLKMISLNNLNTGIRFYLTVLINGLSVSGVILILLALFITAIHKRKVFIILMSWILPFIIFYSSFSPMTPESTDLNFRYLLLVLPALFIGVAVALDWAFSRHRISVTLLMLLFIAVVTYPQIKTVEENLRVHPGEINAINNVSELANAIPQNSIVFAYGMWNTANTIQSVIKFEKNSTVVSLPLMKGELRPLIDSAIAEKGEAWMLINSNGNYTSDLNDLIVSNLQTRTIMTTQLTLLRISNR